MAGDLHEIGPWIQLFIKRFGPPLANAICNNNNARTLTCKSMFGFRNCMLKSCRFINSQDWWYCLHAWSEDVENNIESMMYCYWVIIIRAKTQQPNRFRFLFPFRTKPRSDERVCIMVLCVRRGVQLFMNLWHLPKLRRTRCVPTLNSFP